MVAVVLHELIEAQAKRTPDATALVYEQQRLTYAELDARASRLAQSLAAQGVGPDVTVALHVERSLEMVVGILAILKAGGAYVPIDTGFPAERVAFMVSDSRARLVLTKESFNDGNTATPAPVAPHHLAYVIYTSGSTGKPKGVGIEHRNIVNYVRGVSERFGFEPGMQHAIISTIAADLGNTVLFPALATGGTLHVIAQERAENGALLAEYFAREKIDVLKIVPSHFAALNPERVMPRRRLILGGEASRLEWVAKLRAIAPACEIHNHYGPTETTVGVLTYRVGAELPVTPSGNLPLGKPLPGSEIRLEDGELCIGGAGVARGYLNRPELTAEKFAGGFYRTGDRARLLPDGNYEFCGRVDHQVKVHGYRVELGEIESALREQVPDAVVLLREEQLVAYVTGGERAALRDFLKGRLPPYMVPSAFVFLGKLPLNANGKIDRQALAALPIEAPAPSQRSGAPRTETEKTVAAIWAELLRVEHVGVDDDVFDLGAQSLMAMKALARIRDAFQVNLSLRNLFEHPTVAGLAGAIDGLTWVAKPKATAAQGEREEIAL